MREAGLNLPKSNLFNSRSSNTLKRIALVGAGPGSVDLMTLRGLKYLQVAQVVLTDSLVDEGFKELAPDATWIQVGKRGVKNLVIEGKIFKSCPQDRIDAQLLLFATCGFRVVRLKGGDPSLFARAEEEIAVLQNAGFDFEIVPGVTSALAAAADAKTPLTRRGRGRSVSFQTAITREEFDLNQSLTNEQLTHQQMKHQQLKHQLVEIDSPQIASTVVLYMAGQQLDQLLQPLIAAGWVATTPIRLVSCAGSSHPIISSGVASDLALLAPRHAGHPTITIIGVGAEEILIPAVESTPNLLVESKAQILPPQLLISH